MWHALFAIVFFYYCLFFASSRAEIGTSVEQRTQQNINISSRGIAEACISATNALNKQNKIIVLVRRADWVAYRVQCPQPSARLLARIHPERNHTAVYHQPDIGIQHARAKHT